MEPDARRHAAELFEAILGLDEENRAAFLDEACANSAALRSEVESLLSLHAKGKNILDTPAELMGLPLRNGSEAPRADAGQLVGPGRQLGDFQIERQLGAGGMGIVYQARQVSLSRQVALKVLPPGLGLTSTARLRFHREAQAAAKLHHTNIVAVYAEGEDNGTCYYAMELIEGQGFDEIIVGLGAGESRSPAPGDTTITLGGAVPSAERTPRSSRSSPSGKSTMRSGRDRFDAVARWIAEVADALDYAHDQGVVHRDVKPSNLMLGRDGRVRLMDFGLARMLEEPGMTLSGEFLGTPRYMSPEQITAGRVKVDHRTDIYSLGATLYELLTSEPPFPSESREQIIAEILAKDPRRPRQINRQIPMDLETICLKALEKDRDRRYQTAGQMAEDLRRYINRFAIAAKRTGPLGRMSRWVRRHPALTSAIACAAVLGAATLFLAYRSHAASRIALQQTIERTLLTAMAGDHERADRLIDEVENMGGSTGWVSLLRGQVEYQRGNLAEAHQHLEDAAKSLPDSAAAHGMLVWTYLLGMGEFEKAMKTFEKLQQLELVTPEDYLFAGHATAFMDPPSGLAMLDEAIRRRDSSLARLIRSRARSILAMDTGQPNDAERAIEDLTVARAMLGDNPYVLAASVETFLIAASAYRRAGQPDKYRSYLDRAGRDVAALQSVRNLPIAINSAGWYYELINDEKAAREVWSRGADARMLATYGRYAALLYRTGTPRDLQSALEMCERVPNRGEGTWLEVERAHVLAELDFELARRTYQELMQRAQEGPCAYDPAIQYITLARFLGETSEADAASRQLKETMQLRAGQEEWTQNLLDFNCGRLDATELVMTAGESLWFKCEAYYHIAMKRLAEGDRDGARNQFRACLETQVFVFFEHTWARAFLARLERDPEWPPWIEHKQPTVTQSSRPE